MQIRKAAAKSGVITKTTRYCEQIGLVPGPAQTHNDYQDFDETYRTTLKFVQLARDSGFSLKNVRGFLDLARDQRPTSVEV